MAANNWHIHILHIKSLGFCHKCVGAHNVQCGHSHQLLLVIHTSCLQNFGSNGDCGVDRIGDDVKDSLQQRQAEGQGRVKVTVQSIGTVLRKALGDSVRHHVTNIRGVQAIIAKGVRRRLSLLLPKVCQVDGIIGLHRAVICCAANS